MNKTICDIIDMADSSGYATISFKSTGIYSKLPTKNADALRKLLEQFFYSQPLLTLKLSKMKKWITDIEATGAADEKGDWTVHFNVARLFYLPCEKPMAELAQLRELFETMKEFFKKNSHRRSDVQICNNRDNNKRVYGAMSCRVEAKKDLMEKDEQFTAVLQHQIDASSALQFFMKEVALALQKMGPWSWCCIDEDQLFGPHAGPWSIAWFEAYRANQKKPKKVKPENGRFAKKQDRQ